MIPNTARIIQVFQKWSLPLLLAFCVLVRGGKGLESLFLTAVVVCLLFLFSVQKEKKQMKEVVPLWMYCLGLLFFLLTLASFVASKTQNYGFDEVMGTGACSLLALLVLRAGPGGLWNDENFLTHIAEAVTIATIVGCFIGAIVYAYQPVDRFVGSFFDPRFHTDFWPNAFAEEVLLVWPLAILALRRRTAARILTLSILLGSLFLSYSRGAVLSLLVQIILASLLLLVAWRGKKYCVSAKAFSIVLREALIVFAFGVIIFYSLNLLRAQFHPVQSVSEKVTFTAVEGRSSIDERRQFWEQAILLTKQRPLLGFGPYSFRFVQPALQKSVLATSDHPHNVFLKLTAERGLPAGLVFFVLVVCAYIGGFLTLKKSPSDASRFATFVALLSFTGVLVHNQIDFNLQFFGILLPFVILLAFLLRAFSKAPTKVELRRIIESILVMFLLLSFVLEGRFLFLSHEGRVEAAKNNIPAALVWFDATRGSIFPRDLELTRAELLQTLKNTDGALEAIQAYQQGNAEDARAWLLKADLERFQGRFVAARRDYDEAFSHGAYNLPGAMRGLLQTSLSLSDAAFLAPRRAEFETLYGEYAKAIMQNAHFIDLSRSVEEFGLISNLLLRAYPKDQEILRSISANALTHAATERAKYRSRNPGVLW